MPAPASGLREAGVPLFAVYGLDSLGLDAPPTDLGILPDGRLVLAAGTRLAFGDGTTWEVFRATAGTLDSMLGQLAIGADGRICQGRQGGFGWIELLPEGRWTNHWAAQLPSGTEDAQLPINSLFRMSSQWLWLNGASRLFSWKPGEEVRRVGQRNDVRFAFELGDRLFLVGADGQLHEQRGHDSQEVPGAKPDSASFGVSCAVPFGTNAVLLGTFSHGLFLFDGETLRPYDLRGVESRAQQVIDLCELGSGLYAAAGLTRGLVFFDQHGQVVRVLDRQLDHRLGAFRKLAYHHGTLWGLLNEGLVRVEFPSPFSDFRAIMATSLGYFAPCRHEGRLWALADGMAFRAEYSSDGRLERLVEDSPPAKPVWTVAAVEGLLLACTEQGVFQKRADGWELVADGLINARIQARAPDGRWLCVAKGELAWVRVQAGRPVFERYATPELGLAFEVVQARESEAWCELGVGQVGRIGLTSARPELSILGGKHGMPEDWVQIWKFDDQVRFSVAARHLRFDAAAARFLDDVDLVTRYPEVAEARGRLAQDSHGRLWVCVGGTAKALGGPARPDVPPLPGLPLGFTPVGFKMEEQGVVWIQASQRVIRYDPREPVQPLPTVHPVITRVRLAGSGQVLQSPQGPLLLPAQDNSLEFHFAAPHNPFRQSVSLEVRLDGLSDLWVTREGASAAYNHLREGQYRFRVRPVVNGELGPEASLAFAIAPPWFRTPWAYTCYVGGGLLLLAGVAGLVYLSNRQKQLRLAALVAERTRELQSSEDQLRRAVEGGGVGLWEWNVASGECTGNPQFRRVLGLAPHPTGLTFEQFTASIHPEDRDETQRLFQTVLGQPGEFRHEFRVVHPDKSVRWILAVGRGSAEAGHPTTHLRGAVLDITERRQAQEEHKALEAQLLQVQKMEAIGQLSGGVAHDFNNLLTIIQGHGALLESMPEVRGEAAESVQEIQRAAERASNLTRQLLAFSRRQHLHPVNLNLNDVVANLTKMLQRIVGEDISMHLHFSPEPVWVHADEPMLGQVLLNLVVNARDAMPHGGKLVIETAARELTAGEAAQILQGRPGRYACLSVSDTGSGIAPEVQPHIFEPFFTTKGVGKGTGLGLATVYGIVQQHEGWITVHSEVGRGTLFRIYLPRLNEAVSSPGGSKGSSALQGGKETILVVEDEPPVRNLVHGILSRLGYQVIEAHSGVGALEVWKEHADKIQLMLTDMVMPDNLTGLELAKRLRAEKPSLRVIFTSGYSPELAAQDVTLQEGVNFIAKPFTPGQLAAIVRANLERSQPPLTPPAGNSAR